MTYFTINSSYGLTKKLSKGYLDFGPPVLYQIVGYFKNYLKYLSSLSKFLKITYYLSIF